MTSGPVLVTGAAGFIGRAAAARLADAGLAVRAGLRRAGPPPELAARPGVVATRCDLDDPEQIRAAVAGAAVVVHAAYGADGAMSAQVERLLGAMAAQGVPGFVYLSSIDVYGARAGLIVESDATVGDPGRYGAAKIAAEAMVRAWAAAAPERRALLLRPGAVYGRDSTLWVGKMIERLRVGALDVPAPAPAPLVHVDDVAEAIARGAGRLTEEPAIEGALALNLVGPESPSWHAYFAALASAAGLPPPRPAGGFDAALVRALSLPAKAWARLGLPGFRRFALAPATGELALFRRDARFSMDEAERLIGFRPAIGLAEGLKRSLGV